MGRLSAALLTLRGVRCLFSGFLLDPMRDAERSIRTLAVLSVAIPAVVFVASARTAYDDAFAEAQNHLKRTAEVTREHAIKVFETLRLAALHVDEVLDNLSDEQIKAGADSIKRRLQQLDETLDQIRDIWVIGKDGSALVTATASAIAENANFADRACFKAHKEGSVLPQSAYIGTPARSDLHKEGVKFVYSVARRSKAGEFNGVIAISVSPGYFWKFYRDIANTGVSAVSLVRNDGIKLAQYPGEPAQLLALPPDTALLDEVKKSPLGGAFAYASAGRIFAYSSLTRYPLLVTVGLDKAVVISRWWHLLYRWLLFGLPATAALFGMCMVALYYTGRAIKANEELQQEIALREASEQRARHLQKMEAVGQLTGGIAHDFNNLLTVILGSLELMQRRLARGDLNIQHLAATASGGAQRAATLTAQLLAFARRQPLDPKPINPNKLISGIGSLISSTAGEAIEIETVLAAGLWQTNIDANQLENAIINLAANARDAMPEGGKLTIETANACLDEAYAASEPGMLPGQYVAICVTDTGRGMSPENARRAFDPFFTTKEHGRGTGLGLSQVFGFVNQSGGHVKIYSELGQGSSVKIYLPRHFGAEAQKAAAQETAEEDLRGSGTILVAEDEEAVRSFSRQALEELEYRVLEASDGPEALKILEEHSEIALLLTDIVMPGMTGKRLAEKARAMRPGLRVLYMTGYSRNAVIHNGTLDPRVSLITKPFTVEQLARKLKSVLEV